DEPSRAATVYRHVLGCKGALAARQAEEQLARANPELRQSTEQLREVRFALGRLASSAPQTARQRTEWLRQFDDLEKRKDQLGRAWPGAAGTFGPFALRPGAGGEVAARPLPAGAVLVDFVGYVHSPPPPQGKVVFSEELRFLAFIVKGGGPACVPLGPAEP